MTRSPEEAAQPSPRSSRRRRGFLALVCGALALIGALTWQQLSGHAESSPGSHDMPQSPAIEDRYGVRLLGAYLTAADGMIEIQYQIIDPVKAESIHDDAVSPVLDVRGVRFDTPGMVGHGHSKETPVAGRTGYVLLANSLGLLHHGDEVSIVVGELSLGDVYLR